MAVVPDQFRHEIATGFNPKGRGLVALTSCSHRGVVYAHKQAHADSGIKKVRAVIGGFRLAPYYVQETIAEGNRASGHSMKWPSPRC
jgi:7,8-dihydropterin-6-yl-methyl-4-(beta-D-ribofuranosyl)aminobenzene 5'-phosphate synthase